MYICLQAIVVLSCRAAEFSMLDPHRTEKNIVMVYIPALSSSTHVLSAYLFICLSTRRRQQRAVGRKRAAEDGIAVGLERVAHAHVA